MDRRRFLVGVLATGAAAVGAAPFRSTPALAAKSSGSTRTLPSAERFLLSTARRALS